MGYFGVKGVGRAESWVSILKPLLSHGKFLASWLILKAPNHRGFDSEVRIAGL
jgi:hypothetical protein